MSISNTSVAERTKLQSRKRNREIGVSDDDLVSNKYIEEFGVSGKKLDEIVVDNNAREMGSSEDEIILVDDDYVSEKSKEMVKELHDDIIIVDDDDDLMINNASKSTTPNDNGITVDSSIKVRIKIITKDHKSSCNESKEEGNYVKESDEIEEINRIEFERGARKNKRHRSENSRKEKNHLVHKTNTKLDKEPTNESNDIDDVEKTNAKDNVTGCNTKVCKAKDVKYQKPKKGKRKDDGVSVGAVLDSIIRIGSVHGKEGDNCIPLQFRFDESEDECSSKKSNESDVEGLFQEMDFGLQCEEIGSYITPTVENRETSEYKLCQKGEHHDIYLEEQTGMRCRLCGAVVLESRYVIPKLANYAPDKSKSSYLFHEQQLSTSRNQDFRGSDYNHLAICKQTKGTVWELIPPNIRAHLYPHQEEGFMFLWENVAGTIELSRLKKLDPHGGGGCIISHAPGTGKTFLTIVFIDSFLKKFPKCCPVIVAPANMLLTWEAEFKKWQVGFSFINLNNSEFLIKEMITDSYRPTKTLIRAMKISCWSNGGSVLGVSYHLYEKLAGNTMNKNLEKMGNVLLNMPELVVLDEGHTPRNQNSKIWKILLKLTTKNRVILSGTPFQNNFKELFNTLRLVRPDVASNIINEKIFADMIHQNNKKKSEDIEKLKVIISPFVHVHKGYILESKLPGLKQSVVLLNPSQFQKSFIKNIGNFTKTFEYEHKVALVSVHPSLVLYCSVSEKEKESMNKEELEKVRLHPELGVKTRFVMELVRLSVSLHEKVLIFSQYIQPLELLKDQMALAFGWVFEREIMVINGTTHQKLRQTIINDFNDPNGIVKVLLASTRCCSEGIHLYGASRVVLLDVVWNPSVEKQAISRAYRLGQKKVVYTYHLMTAGTTEEKKYDRQVEKGRLAEMVFSSRAIVGEEPKNNKKVDVMELNDKILEQLVNHEELKDMFKKIKYPENQTRI